MEPEPLEKKISGAEAAWEEKSGAGASKKLTGPALSTVEPLAKLA